MLHLTHVWPLWSRWLLFSLAVGLALVLYKQIDPTSWWMPKCVFRIITGLQCPGCGGQRALHALLQGHFREAAAYNYFIVVAGPYVGLFILEWLLPHSTVRTTLINIIENKWVVRTYIIVFIGWWIIRNIIKI